MLENTLVKNKKNYNTILSRRGYSISKDFLSEKELKNIKKELTVAPLAQVNYGLSPPSFNVYKESKQRLYVPKSYGKKNYYL